MRDAKGVKRICCLLAAILLLCGMSVEMSTKSSSFLRAENTVSTSAESLHLKNSTIDATPICTLSMLNDGMSSIRSNMSVSMMRWQDKGGFLILVVGVCLHLFYYQSEEGKEDGQLFASKSLIVDYIHLLDNGE